MRQTNKLIKQKNAKIFFGKAKIPASWSSGNIFVSVAGDLRLKSRAGQIGHSIANGSPPLGRYFERSCAAWAQESGDGPYQLVTRFGVLQRV